MLLGPRLVDDIDVVEERVHSLDARYLHASLLRKLDGRPKICLDFHRSPRGEVLVHYAVRLRWRDHLLHRLFPETTAETAALDFGECHKFINDSSDQRADANLL